MDASRDKAVINQKGLYVQPGKDTFISITGEKISTTPEAIKIFNPTQRQCYTDDEFYFKGVSINDITKIHKNATIKCDLVILVIFTIFHNWIKIVDFSVMAYFWASISNLFWRYHIWTYPKYFKRKNGHRYSIDNCFYESYLEHVIQECKCLPFILTWKTNLNLPRCRYAQLL